MDLFVKMTESAKILLSRAARWCEENNCTFLYGDTDTISVIRNGEVKWYKLSEFDGKVPK